MAVGERPEFIIRPAEPQDADEIARIYNSAFLGNALWGLMMADVEPSVIQEFTANAFRTRAQLPHTRYFVAMDTSNQRIAGGASMSLPLEDDATAPPASVGASAHQWPEGINESLAYHFYEELLGQSKTYGFDPTRHCHQTGIYVDEKYQRRGVGALLVRYGNGLADSIKAGTYVGVVDASIGLFKRQGFSEQGHIDSRLEEYGGPEKVVRSTVCFRPAAGSE